MSDQPHKPGCPAQPGYGHAIEPCICGVSDQPQEWTPELEKLVSDALDNAITALGQCQKGTARQFLRSAIDAALAAERKKREFAESKAGAYLIAGDTIRQECERLEQQLATVREKFEELKSLANALEKRDREHIISLKEQLASERKAALSIAAICGTTGCGGTDGGITSAVRQMAGELTFERNKAADAIKKNLWLVNENLKLQKELAAERRLRQSVERDIVRLNEMVSLEKEQLRQQLDSEREKLVQAEQSFVKMRTMRDETLLKLASERENRDQTQPDSNVPDEITQLREQLAAEREKFQVIQSQRDRLYALVDSKHYEHARKILAYG
jgi:hypothetical protein